MASEFVAFDFETANYQSDSACSIGLVRVRDFQVVDQKFFLIRPPSRRFFFTPIHGLKWVDVEAAPDFGELWTELGLWFQNVDFVAAHNVGFDRRVLKACCERFGILVPEVDYVCTVQLARRRLGLSPANLPAVCQALGIPLNHHDAMSDALACAKIAIAAMKNRDYSDEKSRLQ